MIAGITKKESMEFGQVAVLFMLFLAIYRKDAHFVMPAFILTLLTIIVPLIFYPFAVGWWGLSKLLGTISSTITMSLVFFLVVVPVGLCRKLLGIDPLKIRSFKKGKESVLLHRDHLYTKEDLGHTF